MAYYRECPTCGAHLDPGERCMECAEKAKERSAGEAGTRPETIKLTWEASRLTKEAPRKICPYA